MLIPLLGEDSSRRAESKLPKLPVEGDLRRALGGDRFYCSGIETEIDFQLNNPALRRNRMVSAGRYEKPRVIFSEEAN
jgi:hypothetical protein